MEAPEKLYLSQIIYGTYQYQVPDPDDDTQVEYVRKDAVLKEVCEWIKTHLNDDYISVDEESARIGWPYSYLETVCLFRT